MDMLIFKNRKVRTIKKSYHFYVGRGAKAPPFQLKKKKGKGWNIKQHQTANESHTERKQG